LKNNYLYQGAFAELDDDIGWTDFALRNYDAQIGRWVQQDPYQEYASGYVGMGNDPVNLVDPSGGFTIAGLTKAGTALVMTMGGAIIGTAISLISGDDDFTGTLIGAGAGLGMAGLGNLSKSLIIKAGIQAAAKASTIISGSINTPKVGILILGVNVKNNIGQDEWTHEGLRKMVENSKILQTLEKRVYDNLASGFKLKNNNGKYLNPVRTNKLIPSTSYDRNQIDIPTNWDNNQASVGYAWELQNAANYKRGRELVNKTKSKTISKREFVEEAISIDTEAYITALQYNNETYPKQDLIDGDNTILLGLVNQFVKKYLEPGELITEYKPKSGSKAEKKLTEIKQLALEGMKKTHTIQYEKMYESYKR
jgi:RHS repeat-associated protein